MNRSLITLFFLLVLALTANADIVTPVPAYYENSIARVFNSAWLEDGSRLFIDHNKHTVIRVFPGAQRFEGMVLGAGWRGNTFASGNALDTRLDEPGGIATDGQEMCFVSDTGNNRILVTSVVTGLVSLVTKARLCSPSRLARRPNGDLLVLESNGHRVWSISPDGSTQVFAGVGQKGKIIHPNAPTKTRLSFPEGIAVSSDDRVVIADSGNSRLLQVQNGTVTELAGILARGQPVDVVFLPDGTLVVKSVFQNKIEFSLVASDDALSRELASLKERGVIAAAENSRSEFDRVASRLHELKFGSDELGISRKIRVRQIKDFVAAQWPRYYKDLKRGWRKEKLEGQPARAAQSRVEPSNLAGLYVDGFSHAIFP
jgi:sugar lactone lactonase YvrE